jgi:hypothetical protein
VSNNLIYYNNKWGLPNIDIRQKGINYIENNNAARAISSDIMPPSVPTALTTTYISDNQIHLAWNASVDNIGVYRYRIYRNGLAHTYSTAASYIDSNLQAGTAYTYTVTAIDLSGNETSQSYTVTATTAGIAAPAVVAVGGETVTTTLNPSAIDTITSAPSAPIPSTKGKKKEQNRISRRDRR